MVTLVRLGGAAADDDKLAEFDEAFERRLCAATHCSARRSGLRSLRTGAKHSEAARKSSASE